MKVKLWVQEGLGTNGSPAIGGTGRFVETDVTLADGECIKEVAVYEFTPDKGGAVRSSDDTAPVVAYEFINNLVGKTLTLADAAFSDVEQRKAFKDLLTQSIWQWYDGQGRMELR